MGDSSRKSLPDLKREATGALKVGNLEEGVLACRALESLEPDDPAWPQLRAEIHHRLSQPEEELEALVAAARAYTAASRVMQAIATCRMILALDPGHTETQETLERLCAKGGSPSRLASPRDGETADDPTAAAREPRSAEAPLDEIVLTSAVPGARPAADPGGPTPGKTEIPLDPNDSVGELDLELELDLVDLCAPEDASGAEPPGGGVQPGAPLEQLARMPLFESLRADSLARLLDRMEIVELEPDDVVYREGQPSNALFVVLEGALVPTTRQSDETVVKLGVLEPGQFFGELGLVTNHARLTTVRAMVDTRLLRIDRAAMWELLERRPEVMRRLLSGLRERLVDQLIRTSPLFAAFARAKRAEVAKQFKLIEVRDGTALIEQDRESQGLYIVASGRVRVILMGLDSDKELATLGPGGVVGEMSLVGGEAAMASVIAEGKCWAFHLPEDRFRRIEAGNPRLSEILGALAKRRRDENARSFKQGLSGNGSLGMA